MSRENSDSAHAMPERAVRWGDLHNVRDLGGLRGSRGTTRFGRIFRSPRPDALEVEAYLLGAGVTGVQLDGIRSRLLD